ncbi:MAG: hypothetical protein JWQ21_493 [Herminiimonas sp.]|nr:hypothetical protein [Herminiimonas sp.]
MARNGTKLLEPRSMAMARRGAQAAVRALAAMHLNDTVADFNRHVAHQRFGATDNISHE